MLGLVRFRMDRVGISKYSTSRFASSSALSEASRAMPTRAMPHIRLLFAKKQGRIGLNSLHQAHARPDRPVRSGGRRRSTAELLGEAVERVGRFEHRMHLDRSPA